MALLEQINSMKQEGMNDVQIINSLKESGFSPIEINEALSQSKIKAAVSQEIPEDISQSTESGMEGMQASVMSAEEGQNYISTQDQTGVQNIPSYQPTTIPAEQQAAPEQAYYPPEAQPTEQYTEQQAYPPAQEGYYVQALDIETARDISKQEAEEAVKKIRIELSELLKFKSNINFELQDIQTRLAKIESTMNELQFSVIKKVSGYGEQISGISDEIRATQESFSKIVGPFMDKSRGTMQKAREEKKPEQRAETAKKEKPGKQKQEKQSEQKREEKSAPAASFEDYFR